MISGRLRECLKILRWKPVDLAEQLGCAENEVTIWLEGRAVAPIAVTAWLEALVKAYKALPPPNLSKLESIPDIRPIRLTDVDVSMGAVRYTQPNSITLQSGYPRRVTQATGARPALPSGQRKGASNHATYPL